MSNLHNRKDLSILIGNSLDHFDTSLYGLLAPILAPIFFQDHDPLIQLILSYSILATSAVTKPLGSYIFGVIARHDPVKGLSYSLIGVAITTVIIGFLPSYYQIGVLAPILLTFIRMIRGIFSAGEITISKLFILDGKTQTEAIKTSYLYESSTMIGIALASAASWLVILSNWEYGWRICFICGGLTGFVGYFIRKYSSTEKKPETNSVIFQQYHLSAFKKLWNNKLNLLKIAIITSFGHVTYAIPFIVMNSFVPLVTCNISIATMIEFNTGLLMIDMLLIPIIGRFTQKFSARALMLSSSLTLAVSILPLWYFIPGSTIIFITFVRFWIIILGVVFLCPLNAWYKNIFTGSDQYLIVGLGNALGAGTIGHLTPAICLSIWYFTNSSIYIGIYIAIISISTFYVVKTTKNQEFNV